MSARNRMTRQSVLCFMDKVTVSKTRRESIIGCLLGTAVGDALGLPAEGLSQQRQRRILGSVEDHRLLFGHGMISDDTEHTILTAQALIVCGDSPDLFLGALAAKLRLWILLVPPGVGFATLRACLKLCLGISPKRSGVLSAGNGPAMRSALLGVCLGNEPEKLSAFVRASARLTHTDPKAEYGALAVALAAHHAVQGGSDGIRFAHVLRESLPDNPDAAELCGLVDRAVASAARGEDTIAFAATLGGPPRRVTGYVYQTVPVAIHAWLRFPQDYRSAVLGVIDCGGDTDTTAAITGAIVGAGVGEEGIPPSWIDGIAEWPYSVPWVRRLGSRLASEGESDCGAKAPSVLWPALLLRNLFFLVVVVLTVLHYWVLDACVTVRKFLARFLPF